MGRHRCTPARLAALIALATLSACAGGQGAAPTEAPARSTANSVAPPATLTPIGALNGSLDLTTTLTEEDFRHALEHLRPPLSP